MSSDAPRAGPPPGEPARNDQRPVQATASRSHVTVTRSADELAFRRRYDAALRLPPLGDGLAGSPDDPAVRPRSRWPRDSAGRQLAAEEIARARRVVRHDPPPRQVEWGGYDVTTLGLGCPHGR